MEYEPKDLRNCQDKSPNAKDPLSKVVVTKEAEENFKKFFEETLYSEKPVNRIVDVKLSPSAEKYRKAWNTIYKRLPEWRRKEIDKQMESGKLSDKSYDTDFAQQVASLAEKL